ncbi:hypothetical protein [Kitasatospora sp. LaBMicrA B282]|uniref:hypothetical protein n=1 Tax=Kitasatospora sp. LaBMicrA B282 TaxID=3420949 RepID=UPI003D0CFC1D
MKRNGRKVTVCPPAGALVTFNLGGSGGCKVDNVSARLRRAGWRSGSAEQQRARVARQRVSEDQRRAELAVTQAQLAGQRRAHAEALTRARTELEQHRAAVLAAEHLLATARTRQAAAAQRVSSLESHRP